MIKVSIIIPCYNEEKTILEILTLISAQKIEHVALETIVIDDGSKDRTVEILKNHPHLYSKFVQMPKNGGKGAAVKEGLAHATGDYILFQDADLEYDPGDYATLFMPLLRFKADVVMGSRFAAPLCTRIAYFWHKVGNKLITFIFNIINNTTFSDIYSCYLIIRRSLIVPSELKVMGWGQHAEILSLAVKRSKAFYEVPISYYGRTYEEGKKIKFYHTFDVIWTIITTKLRSVRPHSLAPAAKSSQPARPTLTPKWDDPPQSHL